MSRLFFQYSSRTARCPRMTTWRKMKEFMTIAGNFKISKSMVVMLLIVVTSKHLTLLLSLKSRQKSK